MCDIDEPSTAGVVKQHTNLPRLLLDQLHAVFISSVTVIETTILLSSAPLLYLATFNPTADMGGHIKDQPVDDICEICKKDFYGSTNTCSCGSR
ncbi:hypothetical protein N7534_004803 [Penicillium rubens]|nr:hypothetical protein N7534_004803 [Penicillium rubens]